MRRRKEEGGRKRLQVEEGMSQNEEEECGERVRQGWQRNLVASELGPRGALGMIRSSDIKKTQKESPMPRTPQPKPKVTSKS